MVDISHIYKNTIQPADHASAFSSALANAGLQSGIVIGDGKIHRCKVEGDKAGTKNGYYVFYHHPQLSVGIFGSWKGDWQERWYSKNETTLTVQEHNEVHQRIEEARRQQAELTRQQNEDAAQQAYQAIQDAQPANQEHPYLTKKQVKPYQIYQQGALLYIPMLDATGTIVSYQTINEQGDKRFLKGGKKKGCFYPIGQLKDTIYIAEGYSTAAAIHAATDAATFVAFDCGNLKPVAETLRAQHPDKKIVLCADNDMHTQGNPGITKAKEAAKAVGGVVKYPMLSGDFNDLMMVEGLSGVRRELGIKHQKTIIGLNELFSAEFTTDYIIDKRIVERGVNQIFGESGHLKSFVSLDMMMHVACGKDWHGYKVKKGRVLYVVGEDLGGYKQRAAAWCKHHNIDPKDVDILFRVAPVMFPDPAAVIEFRQELDEIIVQYGDSPILITLDTKARCFLGNENSTEDANNWVSAVDEIIRDYQTTMLIVHHTGHMEKDRSRGAYAFLGALDSEYKVTKSADDFLNIKTVKPPKNDEAPPELFFKAQKIDTQFKNREGYPLTSLVLVRDDAPPVNPMDEVSKRDFNALDILNQIYEQAKAEKQKRGENVAHARIELKEWKQALIDEGQIKGKTNTINQSFYRIRDRLSGSNLIKLNGVFVIPVVTQE